jgi:hypothetical protein
MPPLTTPPPYSRTLLAARRASVTVKGRRGEVSIPLGQLGLSVGAQLIRLLCEGVSQCAEGRVDSRPPNGRLGRRTRRQATAVPKAVRSQSKSSRNASDAACRCAQAAPFALHYFTAALMSLMRLHHSAPRATRSTRRRPSHTRRRQTSAQCSAQRSNTGTSGGCAIVAEGGGGFEHRRRSTKLSCQALPTDCVHQYGRGRA